MDSTSECQKPAGSNEEVVKFWLAEIDAAKKRESDFRKDGQRIIKIYEGAKGEQTPFNILFSNTETLMPALYSTVPRPVVQRRFKDTDPLGKAAAQAGERVLAFHLDTNTEGYECFDDAMKANVLDAILPGRGVMQVKYDSDTTSGGYTKAEQVYLDTKPWNRVFFGYAKKWSDVPWVAYEEHIDKDEATRILGDAMAGKLIYTDEEGKETEDDRTTTAEGEEHKGARKTCCVYQIWDKTGGRKIRYISAQYKQGYLKEDDDPLELTGFFNCPKPIKFIDKCGSLTPTALYMIYEEQAKELNELTRRIRRIAKAIKAKGVYDSELGEELKKLMDADDNELVPADKSSSLAAEKGLQNAIWFMPIEQLIATLVQLLQARESCKQVIYEITGIADIMRGSTQASETATAQNIKSQWGTLRLKRLQKEVQRYARDILRMMLEIAATKFSEETWANMTGLPFVTTQQRQQMEMVAQAMQQAAAMGQQIPPEQAQQMQAELQKPVWGQVLEMLRDDMSRAYRIDIETNSTIEPEAAEDQEQIVEMLTAMGQYLNGVAPLVQSKVLPMEMAQGMLLTIVRRFRFGDQVEQYIEGMQQPEDPEAGKQQAEQQKQQAEMQMKQQEHGLKMQEMQAKIQFEREKLELEKQKMALELEKAKMQMQLDGQKMQMDQAMMQQEHGMKRQQMDMDMEMQREQHLLSRAEMHDKHEMSKEQNKMKLQQQKQQAQRPVGAKR